MLLSKSQEGKSTNNRQTDTSYNYALSQLFSPSLLNKIHNESDLYNIRSLIQDCNLYHADDDWNLVKALEIAYDHLKEHYRCEYIYKNEIANQLLLKFHSDNSATLLKEVNSDSSIADIVIINGDTVAYEIKTELDSFERLPKQLSSYQSLYDFLYIVTHPGAEKTLINKINNDIGIMLLNNDGVLKTVRYANKNKDFFDPSKAVFTLRQSELVAAYEKHVSKMPLMGTALIYSFCHDWYVNLEREDARIVFAEALKSRRPLPYQFNLITECHPALKMLFLGREIPKKTCQLLVNKLCIFA